MHVYVYCKALSALHFKPRTALVLAAFMIFMVFGPLLVHWLKVWGLEFAARGMAYGAYMWMGFVFLSFSGFLAMDSYNILCRLVSLFPGVDLAQFVVRGRTSFFAVSLAAITIGCYGVFAAQQIRTEKVSIVTSKLPEGVDGFTIAQISDIHLGLIVRHGLLEKRIEAVNTAGPDLLVSTGDLGDAEINHLPGLAELFQQVNPRYGKFAVTGNHEFYAGIKEAISFTERAGFVVLRGNGVEVNGIFNVVGIDDPAGVQMGQVKFGKENKVLEGVSLDLFTIFLKHRPEIRQESFGLFDLQLSGHAHRGQIFPFSLITHLVYPIQSGLYENFPCL